MTQTSTLRHTLALGLAVALFALPATPNDLQAQVFKHGDVNGDGVVSALDAQAILTGVVDLPLPAGFVLANGDANCDETTGALDAQIVLSFVIGLDVSQHCVGQNFGPGATQVDLSPVDSSLLVGRGMWMKATLRDSTGAFLLERPVSWSTSNAAIVAIDTMRNDSAFVRGMGEGTATITANADGSGASTTMQVVLDYRGIVIVPQRGDTIFQLNDSENFHARMRDSVGTFTGEFPAGFWTVADTNIAQVTATAANNVSVFGRSTGMTWVRVVNQANPSDRDSVQLHVILPPVNSCTGEGGTLHSSVTYSKPQTWSPATNPHYVHGLVQFDSTATLTIEPGTLVCMASSAWMYFRPGAELRAVGTAALPINIQSLNPTSPWYQIQLGDDVGHQVTAPMDTSRLRHVVVEGGNNWYGSISGWERHVVEIDSSRFRRIGYSAVQLSSAWSRMAHSVVDTVGVWNAGYAVKIHRGRLDSTTIRVGNVTTSAGIALEDDSGAVRGVTIDGAERGIYITSGSADSARINDVTISGTSGYALDLANSSLHSGSANITIVSGARSFRGAIENFARLFPDSVVQETLLNADVDTIEITGGVLERDTVVARVQLPWHVTSSITIDADALLRAHPGAVFSVGSGSFQFQDGGTLDAHGTVGAPVRFERRVGQSFSGLAFENPPGTERDTSRLRHVRIWGASGACAQHTCSAIASWDRHVLLIDSTEVAASGNGGVGLSAAGSRIVQTYIDSTGSPTAGYPGLYLHSGTYADSVRVRRSGTDGVLVGGGIGDTVRLRHVRVAGSLGIGLHAEGARIVGDSGTVVLENNAYPYRGYFDSFAALARDSVSQRRWVGNTEDVAVIHGRSDRTFRGRAGMIDTMVTVPELRLQLESDVYVDTLAVFMPRAGTRVTFWNGGMLFQRGGRLVAHGTATDSIRFERVSPASGTFSGLVFFSPGAAGGALPPPPPTATSELVNVAIGEATGRCADLGCATIATTSRHIVLMDSSRVRMASSGAVHLAARASRISRTRIDTTLSTSYAALALAGGTMADSVTVYGAGQAGVYIHGSVSSLADTVRLHKVTIDSSKSVGLWAENGRLVGDSGSVVSVRNAYAFRGYIDNFAAIAKDSLSQLNFLGNVTDRVEIVGRSDRTFRGRLAEGERDTLRAIPQIDWLIESHAYIDSLGVFAPYPGTRVGFWSAGMTFREGGRLYAHGTATDTIEFAKYSPSSGSFNGMHFADAGGVSLDSSVIINARFVNSGAQCGPLGCAVLVNNPGHVLVVDSVYVRQASSGAIHLSAPGSRISRSVIDTAGNTSYAALALGAATLAESTTVRFARDVGVAVGGSTTALGDTVRLRDLHIENSGGVALLAEGGRILGDSGSVYATGNAYAFRGYIDNFAAIAKDSIAQLNLVGNDDSRVEIRGGSNRPFRGRIAAGLPDTIRAIKQLPWLVFEHVYMDSLARFIPHPGARIGFWGAGMTFQKGSRLIAHGTPTDTVVFERWSPSSGNFNGLYFGNRGASAIDTSWVVNTVVRNGQSCQNAALGCSILATENRHVLLVDSARVSSVSHGAVHLAAAGSSIRRSVIDTAGNSGNYPLALGPATLAESTTVNHSRTNSVWVAGADADTTALAAVRLRQVQILNGNGPAVYAEDARLVADSVSASGNAYPFYGFLDNFVALAPNSIAQERLLGNIDDVVVIIGNSNRGLKGTPIVHVEVPLTAVAIPQLRWQVQNMTYFDSLSRFEPLAGANITFANSGGLTFRKGAHMLAFGTASDSIYFRPIAGHAFQGILLDSPGGFDGEFPPGPDPVASSWLKFVNIDSTSGVSTGSFGNAGLNAANRHQVTIEDSRFRRSRNGAIALQAPNSALLRVRVDTTGNLTTSWAALQLEDSVSLQDVTVFRSGQNGIDLRGRGITFDNVTVDSSLGVGIHIDDNSPTGSRSLQLSSFLATRNAQGGVVISADSVQLTSCSAIANGTTAAHHGVATAGSIRDVSVMFCDLVNNAGNGVNNGNTSNAVYFINAANNWWGDAGGPSAPLGDGISANVGTDGSCSASCSNNPMAPVGSGSSLPPALPAERVVQRPMNPERRRRRQSSRM